MGYIPAIWRLHPQPSHRRKGRIAEFPMNAQGEDAVAGIRNSAADLRAGRYHAGGLSAVC